MSFTRDWHRNAGVRLAALGAAIALSIAAWAAFGGAAWAYGGGVQAGAETMAQAQERSGAAEANLPFLFAVYIITWAAFFAYVFYVSRRQREMQGEIEAIKRALDERDRQDTEQ